MIEILQPHTNFKKIIKTSISEKKPFSFYILSFKSVATTIQEICADEKTTCLLSQQKAERNGIQVCIDSTVRTSPCPEVVVSDQKYCRDFYVYTLNCTVLQQSRSTVASTTLMTSAAQTVTDKNSSMFVNGGIFLFKGCSCFIAHFYVIDLYTHGVAK